MAGSQLRGRIEIMREYFSLRMVAVLCIASLNTFSLGYDVGWWSVLIGVPYFQGAFGTKDTLLLGALPWKTLSSTQLSLGGAAPFLGALIGGPFAVTITEKLGRKAALWLCSVVTIVASIIEITCSLGEKDRYWQLVAGKGVVGIATALGTVTIPLYLSEIAPAPIRGAAVNTLVLSQWLGTFLATAVGYSQRLDFTRKVWLLPIGIQFVMPTLSIGLTFLLPESPRWLLSRGRQEDALRSVERLRIKAQGYSPQVQIAQVQQDLTNAQNLQSTTYKECFQGMNLRRTLIAVGIMAFSAGSGLGFISNYSILILAHFSDKYFEIFLGILGALVLSVCIGFITQDLLGRRVLLLSGSVVAFACMLAYAIISTVSMDSLTGAAGTGGIIAITIWLVNFTQTWSAVPFTVFSEIPSVPLREKVIALSIVVYQLVNLVIVLVSPYIQGAQNGKFQGKIGYIYAGVSFCSFFFVYFLVPDLRGRSLLDIDRMFDDRVPLSRMHKAPRPYVQTGGDTESFDKREALKLDIEQIEMV